MLKSLLTFILFFLSIQYDYGQFGFEFNDSIVVKVGNDTLTNAWGGGLNSAQLSDFDYDFDGDLDLFVFDRSKNNIRVFTQENDGGKYYKIAYNAREHFPKNLRYRTTLIDYNQDGKKDIFTYGIGGLKVYKNIGNISTGLDWELVKEIVYSQYPNTYSNLNISSGDIPAIIDVDFDGDIDVLTFHQGGSHVEYHQNQSMELYGVPDSLEFELKNECWGKFSEDGTTNAIILNDPNSPCVGGNIANPLKGEKHTGSTLMAFDYDNSGVLDLLIGDVSYNNLNLLINGGGDVNMDSPMVSVDSDFPSNTTPVNIQLFPAAFNLDVDFDGIKDIVVCPNAKINAENEKSVLFYKNIGTNENPNYLYTTNEFLQNEMLEFGAGTTPVFFDFNEDGLDDLFIANNYRYISPTENESTIAYFLNTGTADTPVFTYIDYDFLNLSFQNFGLKSTPTFGDIDNDGDKDLIIGTADGSLIYYENYSTGSGAIFNTFTSNYADNLGNPISTTGHAHPQLFDLNEDGLLDIILGNRSGNLVYYQNIGSANSPSFELTNPQLGNVNVSSLFPDGYSAPHFFKHEDEIHLFCGGIEGNLMYFNNISGNLGTGQSFDLIASNYLGINVEAYSTFFVNDIDNDGNLNLFVGQDLGGLFHFEANPNSSISVDELSDDNFHIYPNPASESITIQRSNSSLTSYTLTNLNGRVVSSGKLNKQSTKLPIGYLSKGIYFIQVETTNHKKVVKKMVVN